MKEVIAVLKRIQQEAKGRATAFVVGNTSDLFSTGRLYETPVRATKELIYGGVIVRDVTTARAVSRLIDGKVDYVFVDDEKKIRKIYYGPNDAGNIEKTLRGLIKKSKLLSYKGNDLTVEATDSLICTILPEVSGSRVAIVGMGNFGSKLALKLVERGANIAVYRRNQKKLHTICAGLNEIKSAHTISKITPTKSIPQACKGANMVIGITNEKEVITRDMLEGVAPDAILIDAGKGCFARDVTDDPARKIFRVDVSIMQKHIYVGLIRTYEHFSKPLGRRFVPELGVSLISMGLLGRKGEVIVDDIANPKSIIGISAGGGVLIKKNARVEKDIRKFKNFFKLT